MISRRSPTGGSTEHHCCTDLWEVLDRSSPRTFVWEASADSGASGPTRPDAVCTRPGHGWLISPYLPRWTWALLSTVWVQILFSGHERLGQRSGFSLAMNGCVLGQTELWAELCFPDRWLRVVEQLPGDAYWLDVTALVTARARQLLLPTRTAAESRGAALGRLTPAPTSAMLVSHSRTFPAADVPLSKAFNPSSLVSTGRRSRHILVFVRDKYVLRGQTAKLIYSLWDLGLVSAPEWKSDVKGSEVLAFFNI